MTAQDQEKMSATCNLFPPTSWGPLVFLPVNPVNVFEKQKKKKTIWWQKNVSKWLH